MICLSEHIAYLLSRNDCVIVPGWGAFIAESVAAAFDPVAMRWTPPHRVATFNPAISHNDGLLASSLVRGASMTYDEAMRRINEEVGQWRQLIQRDGQLDIAGVGMFRATDPEATPEFIESARSTANMRYMGLTPVAAADAFASEMKSDDNAASGTRRLTLGGHILRAAASVAIIICVAAGLLTTVDNARNGRQSASLFSPATEAEAPVPEIRPIGVDDRRELSIKAVSSEEGTAVAAERKPAAEQPAPVAAPVKAEKRYFLVVASLANNAEAKRFIDSRKKSDKTNTLSTLTRDGRVRVYIASGDSFDEVNAMKSVGNNSRLYPDSWVYVKR